MQFRKLLKDDDAVSPVIGVILMVAITVILAAVIGTFVLGLGENVQQNSPNAQFSFDQSTTDVENDGAGGGTVEVVSMQITHTSGDEVSEDNVDVTVNGQTGVASDGSGDGSSASNVDAPWNDGNDISASDSVTLVGSVALDSGDTASDVEGESFTGSGQLDIDSGSLSGTYTAIGMSSGDTVRVVWESDDGGNSDVLASQDVN